MVEIIKEFIDGIISQLNLNCEANVSENDEEYKVDLDNYIGIISEAENDPDVRSYFFYSPEERSNKISMLQKENKSDEDLINSNKNSINKFNPLIDKLKALKPSIFTEYSDQLSILSQKAVTMHSQVKAMASIVNNYVNGKKFYPKTSFDSHFLSSLWIILAKKFDTVWFNDEFVPVEKVDLNEEAFFTKSGDKIRFTFLSTGQSHIAYVSSLLRNNGDKKLIVILDEVALMDPNLLSDVRSKLQDLYEKDQLIIGFMASPGTTGYEVIQ